MSLFKYASAFSCHKLSRVPSHSPSAEIEKVYVPNHLPEHLRTNNIMQKNSCIEMKAYEISF